MLLYDDDHVGRTMKILLFIWALGQGLGCLALTSPSRSHYTAFAAPRVSLTHRTSRLPSRRICERAEVFMRSTHLQPLKASTAGGDDVRRRLAETVKSLYFPLSVLAAGAVGVARPQAFSLLTDSFVTNSLSSVMVLMGCSLTLQDFRDIAANKRAVLLGWFAQYTIMPSAAWAVSRLYGLPAELAAGVILVGCCPGGTASNLVTLLARADVALSVTMTAFSTVSACLMTPLLSQLLLGALVPVSGRNLLVTTLKVVLGPVLFGLLSNTYILPNLPAWVSAQLARVTPVLSGVLVAAICGQVVARNAAAASQAGLPLVLAVGSLHFLGFLFGFVMSRLLGFSERVARTVSIETGMQNSALACVLARNSLPHPSSSLPGAISACMHSLIGSALAWVWSRTPPKQAVKET